jgi:hypothetical protein
MSFMDETKLKTNMHVNKFDLNLAWQVEANRMLFIA